MRPGHWAERARIETKRASWRIQVSTPAGDRSSVPSGTGAHLPRCLSCSATSGRARNWIDCADKRYSSANSEPRPMGTAAEECLGTDAY